MDDTTATISFSHGPEFVTGTVIGDQTKREIAKFLYDDGQCQVAVGGLSADVGARFADAASDECIASITVRISALV